MKNIHWHRHCCNRFFYLSPLPPPPLLCLSRESRQKLIVVKWERLASLNIRLSESGWSVRRYLIMWEYLSDIWSVTSVFSASPRGSSRNSGHTRISTTETGVTTWECWVFTSQTVSRGAAPVRTVVMLSVHNLHLNIVRSSQEWQEGPQLVKTWPASSS